MTYDDLLTNIEIKFTPWITWKERKTITGKKLPGVYLLSHFDMKPNKESANPRSKEIIYIGETSKRTLNERLNQFERSAFKRKNDHSGGKNYREIFSDQGECLYVALFHVCDLDDKIHPLFIKYIERKLILEYALEWGESPICNKE